MGDFRTRNPANLLDLSELKTNDMLIGEYARTAAALDDAVGRVVRTRDEAGLRGKTAVVFASLAMISSESGSPVL